MRDLEEVKMLQDIVGQQQKLLEDLAKQLEQSEAERGDLMRRSRV